MKIRSRHSVYNNRRLAQERAKDAAMTATVDSARSTTMTIDCAVTCPTCGKKQADCKSNAGFVAHKRHCMKRTANV